MKTVNEVSKISGVSIRALHHYDKIGLLSATEVTDAGYRLYDDAALERLQYILLFKALEFSLKEIKGILDSPDFDRSKALEQQIHLLELRKEHLQNLIDLASGIKFRFRHRPYLTRIARCSDWRNFESWKRKKYPPYFCIIPTEGNIIPMELL